MTRVARNLYLRKGRAGSPAASWILIYAAPSDGRRREAGLGPYPDVSVVAAKAEALRLRLLLLAGRDPLEEQQAERTARTPAPPMKGLTFAAVADRFLAAHRAGWRHPKQARQWIASLQTYAFPLIGNLAVDRVGTAEVMQIVEPIWHQLPATASRVRGRIESVLDYASARHWRSGDNPARWRGHLEALLPARNRIRAVEHFKALPWRELPTLWQRLAETPGTAALALKFAILTAARTGEVLGLQRHEVDFAARLWTVPGERTKTGRIHRVPLSAAALAVLDEAEAIRTSAYQFSSVQAGRPLSHMAMRRLLIGLYPGITVHGMRSAFRDWAAEHGVAREIAEAALAHAVGDQTEAAYFRSDVLEPRRKLMERWAEFLAGPAVGTNVLPLRG
jgi:integrase